jgi:hypothetical protein
MPIRSLSYLPCVVVHSRQPGFAAIESVLCDSYFLRNPDPKTCQANQPTFGPPVMTSLSRFFLNQMWRPKAELSSQIAEGHSFHEFHC